MSGSEIIEKITEEFVTSVPLATVGQQIYFEKGQRGFGLLVGKASKSFVVQIKAKIDGRWTALRRTLGRSERLTVKAARRLAVIKVQELEAIRPEAAVVPLTTLITAWESYKQTLQKQGRSLRTIEGYESHVQLHLKGYLNCTMQSLSDKPAEVKLLHDRLTDERGPYAANGVMRTLSAIYNHAAKFERNLRGHNPAELVDKNAEHRRQTALAPADFPAWWEQLQAFNNRIRAGFHLLTLLTGSRPAALKASRWEHIDFEKRVWSFPSPKGGSSRKFDIPVCDALRTVLLEHQQNCGLLAYNGWIFPTTTREAHLSETKERRGKLLKWGNDLRQTFRTMAYLAGTDNVSIHILMNHRIAGVNAGYLNLVHAWPRLILDQERIVHLIQQQLKPTELGD